MNKEKYVALGFILKVLRERRDLSMRELAQQASCSLSTISMLESGKRAATVDTLYDLARVLDVKLSTIFQLVEGIEGTDNLYMLAFMRDVMAKSKASFDTKFKEVVAGIGQ